VEGARWFPLPVCSDGNGSAAVVSAKQRDEMSTDDARSASASELLVAEAAALRKSPAGCCESDRTSACPRESK
jgi:hypothetical protein